jgi:hypothetical protein
MNLGELIAPRVVSPREQAQHELYLKLLQLCAREQASTEMIAGAAVNLMITVVHRMHIKQGDAEARWDDLCGQGKELLKSRFAKRTRSGG